MKNKQFYYIPEKQGIKKKKKAEENNVKVHNKPFVF